MNTNDYWSMSISEELRIILSSYESYCSLTPRRMRCPMYGGTGGRRWRPRGIRLGMPWLVQTCLFVLPYLNRERVTQHPPPLVGTLAIDTGAWAGRWSTQWRRDLDPPLGTTVGPQRPPVRILCLRGESDNIQATWLTCLRCVATLAQDSLSKVCSNN